MADRVADGNRSGGHSLALLQRLARRRRAAIEADITRTGAAIAALIAADPAPGRTRPASCKACPASLRLAAATRLAEAPELGQLEARQITALAGLAPVTRESGTWRGKATIQGGRRHLRRALTMPTLTAIRRNRDLAALFTRLHAAGKPPGPPLLRRCANASSPPTHFCAKDGTGRTQGQYDTLDAHGYGPGAVAPGGPVARAAQDRGAAPGQTAPGACRRGCGSPDVGSCGGHFFSSQSAVPVQRPADKTAEDPHCGGLGTPVANAGREPS
ncbi:MAG: transposase, partial [Cereibacter sp.]